MEDPIPPRQRYVIQGGIPLEGEVTVPGAKNAVGKQLVASLLTDQPCVFTNVPRITEIDAILDMLGEIGTRHSWLGPSTLQVHTPEIRLSDIGQRYSGFNRIPILLIGPLLHRAGRASVPVMGGCRIGKRPVDFHLDALAAMGATIRESQEGFDAFASRLSGTEIVLPYPSVGATENILLTGSLASGVTTIKNAALEPEVIDTILLLQKMGAIISVLPNRTIQIEGVQNLRGAIHDTVTDRIEVASFAVAAIATDGRITVHGAQQEHMTSFLNTIRRIGGDYDVHGNSMTFYRGNQQLDATRIETDVHPGFATDWQQPLAVLLTQCSGKSVIHETVYEDRFGYTDALRNMGAEIELTNSCLGHLDCRFKATQYKHSCIITGPTQLTGTQIVIPDLRAGFAYVVAALVAKGETEISGLHYLDRGYARIPDKLHSVGARMEVVTDELITRKAG